VIWSPCLRQDFKAIERVQRCFTERLPSHNKYSYCEWLPRVNLPSLELRRIQNDLIWCYKILFGYVDMHADKFFENRVSNTRGRDYKPYKKRITCSAVALSRVLRTALVHYGNMENSAPHSSETSQVITMKLCKFEHPWDEHMCQVWLKSATRAHFTHAWNIHLL